MGAVQVVYNSNDEVATCNSLLSLYQSCLIYNRVANRWEMGINQMNNKWSGSYQGHGVYVNRSAGHPGTASYFFSCIHSSNFFLRCCTHNNILNRSDYQAGHCWTQACDERKSITSFCKGLMTQREAMKVDNVTRGFTTLQWAYREQEGYASAK